MLLKIFLYIVLTIFAVACVTFTFIGIWSFVLFNKMHNQIKYKNYILENINSNISSLLKGMKSNTDIEEEFIDENLIDEIEQDVFSDSIVAFNQTKKDEEV